MDSNKTEIEQSPKRKNYKKGLDTALTPKQRKVAVTVLEADTLTEAAERAGVDLRTVNNAMQIPGVGAMKVGQLVSRDAAMRKILAVCEDILDSPIEAPIKASDHVAAARLAAEISGVLEEKKGDTYNIGVLDLRQATTAELEAELAKTEAMKAKAIDIEPIA